MRALGIVCEYNPFHFGHLYQMEESRRIAEDAAVICVMSGDYVQRGETALLDKFARAEAACRCGADLVVELPLPWCLSSAEGFASGAVSILSALGCSLLSFGSETGELADLRQAAALLLDVETDAAIRELLKAEPTLAYAKARETVLERYLGEKAELLRLPNNILALEYLKAIARDHPDLLPIAVLRQGGGHDNLGEQDVPSAKKIRKLYRAGKCIENYLPPESAAILHREEKAGRVSSPASMEGLLRSRLVQLKAEDFEELPDAKDGAGRRLYKTLREGKGLHETVELASSKRYAKARMRRMLLCAALGLQAEDQQGRPPYVRLLACNKKGRAYLAERKDAFGLPLLTKPSAVRKLGEAAQRVFALGSSAHDLFMLQYVPCGDIPLGEDWKKGPVIV